MTEIFALFPGQGSQKVGMGKALYETYDVAKNLFKTADDALGFSLSSICFEGPSDRLTLTEITQPAILTVSTICYQIARLEAGSSFPSISAAAGHSLGEYSALVAAGALSFEDAVVLVNKRGRYMQEAVPVGTGMMVAVLGKEVSEIEAALICEDDKVAEIANINAPGQIVVAGSVSGVQAFTERLGAAKVIELPVSAPFHCSLMKPAEERLREDLKTVTIQTPKFPIYQNFAATAVTEPEAIRENLARQVCGRVRWVECVERALSEKSPAAVWEFGAGNVLTGLVKRIASGVNRVNIDSPEAISSITQKAA